MTSVPEREPAQHTGPGEVGPSASSGHDLRALFGTSTAVFASLAGPAHMVETANEAFFEAVGGGGRARTGVPLGQLLPEPAEQGFLSPLDRVYRTGTPYTGYDVRVLVGTGPGAREAFFDFTYEPRLDVGGNCVGVRVVGVETTHVKQAQRLTAEHRVLLEQIARQAPLEQVLDGMARAIEELMPEEVLVSVLLADADGLRLRHGAAPSLPDFYNRAIDGIATGDGVGSCGTAAHRRRPVVVSDIATDPFWDDFRDLATAAGLAACWSTPILARDGSLLGTFAMYHRVPREPQDSDLALARVFAETAALAIERRQAERARAEAEAREKAAREDLAFLLKASTALTSDLDYLPTLRELAAFCVPALAPLCAVDLAEAGRLRRVATAAPSDAEDQLLASHLPVYDADDDVVARVLATGVSEVARRAPTGPGPWRDLGVTGYLCIPLTDRGRTFGTLTLLSTGGHVFDGHTVALAEELARRAASAAHNARQYTQRAALARDLQAGLLMPRVPDVPGARIATYYHPAGEGLDIGGDFYDVFPLADGRWAFLLGDVCGRGATAAATTALVRHTARAVARLLPDPPSVVQAINQALLDHPCDHDGGFVTLVYGHFVPVDGGGLDLSFVRAGHEYPVHIDADGDARPVEVPGPLIGIATDPDLPAHPMRLSPGESLLLHTDGITEACDGTRSQFGEERLLQALGTLPANHTAQDAVTALTDAVRSFTGSDGIDDDQAVLVLTAL
ncbi:SpoIIE family protein phosphatase [Streptomyces sp. DSM 110735]|uniref:SpoIIE family protein phosphatase n=1 Tax=Streptomyces sp. DSM 110735 TaxID=2775031 RepID=UPI0018F78087|nr:SpoIIE family protein phosphatase [Streptomyces sp. DSM 110735]MBJ7902438.1 SpoIIE family protein phosphatase [Streptomyces sp. DSM 110735]